MTVISLITFAGILIALLTKDTNVCHFPDQKSVDLAAQELLEEYDSLASTVIKHDQMIAKWNYNINLTDHNKQLYIEQKKLSTQEYGKFANKVIKIFGKKASNCWSKISNPETRRGIKKFFDLGTAILPENDLSEMLEISSQMKSFYSKYHTVENQTLEPNVMKVFKSSKNYWELRHYWQHWFDGFSTQKENFIKFYKIDEKACKMNGFKNCAESWRSSYVTENYSDEDFLENLEEMWVVLKPLYQKLHAYVRFHLSEFYGQDLVSKTGPIPSHLFGNPWAQTWDTLYESLPGIIPYPDQPSMDITKTMVEQNYDAERIFKTAENFFVSLGMPNMTEKFWDHSVIEKPIDPDHAGMVCHPSAWDFFSPSNGTDDGDFRIKTCTNVNQENFVIIHHEMGHIAYFQQYKDQHAVFRAGANPGFHEAVGDTISLAAGTPSYLEKVGLLESGSGSASNSTSEEERRNINYLMKTALFKIAFLPFGYLIDQYRWKIFDGTTSPKNFQKSWDELRLKYQGIIPPIQRSENNFDPAGKYHVSADVTYMMYFVSFVNQFSFYESMCKVAGEYPKKPLYNCDFYQNKQAGEMLMSALKLGSSKPWPEVMEIFTGQKDMSTSSILKYFEPLSEWLDGYLKDHEIAVGWEENGNVEDLVEQLKCFDVKSEEWKLNELKDACE